MNPPWVYMCSPSWTPLPPPTPNHPSGSSQCTSPKGPVSNLDWRFVSYMTLNMFQCHSPKSSHPLPRQDDYKCIWKNEPTWIIRKTLNQWKKASLSIVLIMVLQILKSTGIRSVQSLSHVRLFATPWTDAHQASLSITNSWSLLKLMSIELVMPSNHLILYCPLLLLPSIFPSIRVFSNESILCIR